MAHSKPAREGHQDLCWQQLVQQLVQHTHLEGPRVPLPMDTDARWLGVQPELPAAMARTLAPEPVIPIARSYSCAALHLQAYILGYWQAHISSQLAPS